MEHMVNGRCAGITILIELGSPSSTYGDYDDYVISLCLQYGVSKPADGREQRQDPGRAAMTVGRADALHLA